MSGRSSSRTVISPMEGQVNRGVMMAPPSRPKPPANQTAVSHPVETTDCFDILPPKSLKALAKPGGLIDDVVIDAAIQVLNNYSVFERRPIMLMDTKFPIINGAYNFETRARAVMNYLTTTKFGRLYSATQVAGVCHRMGPTEEQDHWMAWCFSVGNNLPATKMGGPPQRGIFTLGPRYSNLISTHSDGAKKGNPNSELRYVTPCMAIYDSLLPADYCKRVIIHITDYGVSTRVSGEDEPEDRSQGFEEVDEAYIGVAERLIGFFELYRRAAIHLEQFRVEMKDKDLNHSQWIKAMKEHMKAYFEKQEKIHNYMDQELDRQDELANQPRERDLFSRHNQNQQRVPLTHLPIPEELKDVLIPPFVRGGDHNVFDPAANYGCFILEIKGHAQRQLKADCGIFAIEILRQIVIGPPPIPVDPTEDVPQRYWGLLHGGINDEYGFDPWLYHKNNSYKLRPEECIVNSVESSHQLFFRPDEDKYAKTCRALILQKFRMPSLDHWGLMSIKAYGKLMSCCLPHVNHKLWDFLVKKFIMQYYMRVMDIDLYIEAKNNSDGEEDIVPIQAIQSLDRPEDNKSGYQIMKDKFKLALIQRQEKYKKDTYGINAILSRIYIMSNPHSSVDIASAKAARIFWWRLFSRSLRYRLIYQERLNKFFTPLEVCRKIIATHLMDSGPIYSDKFIGFIVVNISGLNDGIKTNVDEREFEKGLEHIIDRYGLGYNFHIYTLSNFTMKVMDNSRDPTIGVHKANGLWDFVKLFINLTTLPHESLSSTFSKFRMLIEDRMVMANFVQEEIYMQKHYLSKGVTIDAKEAFYNQFEHFIPGVGYKRPSTTAEGSKAFEESRSIMASVGQFTRLNISNLEKGTRSFLSRAIATNEAASIAQTNRGSNIEDMEMEKLSTKKKSSSPMDTSSSSSSSNSKGKQKVSSSFTPKVSAVKPSTHDNDRFEDSDNDETEDYDYGQSSNTADNSNAEQELLEEGIERLTSMYMKERKSIQFNLERDGAKFLFEQYDMPLPMSTTIVNGWLAPHKYHHSFTDAYDVFSHIPPDVYGQPNHWFLQVISNKYWSRFASDHPNAVRSFCGFPDDFSEKCPWDKFMIPANKIPYSFSLRLKFQSLGYISEQWLLRKAPVVLNVDTEANDVIMSETPLSSSSSSSSSDTQPIFVG